MLEPANINKFSKKDPEEILKENLIKKYGQRCYQITEKDMKKI